MASPGKSSKTASNQSLGIPNVQTTISSTIPALDASGYQSVVTETPVSRTPDSRTPVSRTPGKTPLGSKNKRITKKEINSKEALRRQLVIERESIRHTEASPRYTWDNTWYYILCVTNLTLGTGNIVNFPRRCYKYEGGTFLVVYLIVMIVFGAPIAYIELIVGQYHRGTLLLFTQRCVPILQGIGWLAAYSSFVCVVSYQFEVAKILKYLLTVLTIEDDQSNFKSCNNTWNNGACYEFFNDQCVKSKGLSHGLYHGSCNVPLEELRNLESGEIQFLKMVHKKSATILEMGSFDRSTFMCLAVLWLITALIFNRGVQKVGQTAAVPITLIFLIVPALFLTSLKMEGALLGIDQMFTINWQALMTTEIWLEALLQCTFSIGVGYGSMITIASFAPPEANTFKVMVLDLVLDTTLSMLCTATVFATLGYMSHKLDGMSIYSIIPAEDTEIVSHIVFPVLMRGVSDQASVWILTYYVVMTLLGWGTSIQIAMAIAATIADAFNISTKTYKYDLISIGVCAVCLATGAILCFEFGDHYVTLLGSVSLVLQFATIMLEVLVVVEFYGIDHVYEDIHVMMGRPVLKFWAQIGYVSPMWRKFLMFNPPLAATVICFSIFQDFPYHANTPGYPYFYEIVELISLFLGIFIIFIFMIYSTLTMRQHMINVEKKKFNWRIMFMKQKQLRCWNRVTKQLLNIAADSDYEGIEEHIETRNRIQAIFGNLPENPPNDVQGLWKLVYRPFWRVKGPKVRSRRAQRLEDHMERVAQTATLQAMLTGTTKPEPVPKGVQTKLKPQRKLFSATMKNSMDSIDKVLRKAQRGRSSSTGNETSTVQTKSLTNPTAPTSQKKIPKRKKMMNSTGEMEKSADELLDNATGSMNFTLTEDGTSIKKLTKIKSAKKVPVLRKKEEKTESKSREKVQKRSEIRSRMNLDATQKTMEEKTENKKTLKTEQALTSEVLSSTQSMQDFEEQNSKAKTQ